MDRRLFMRLIGAGSLAALGFELPVMAGPFDNPNFDVNIPADKKLHPDWVKALFERGTPEVFHGEQLTSIRLPIGGICSGHVYLDGNGNMVDWMVYPIPLPKSIAQGFALRTVVDGKTDVRRLNHQGFPDMTFRGEYPIAELDYADATVPVQTSVEVFSPFIPLRADDSGLPATIYSFTLKNTGASPAEATLAGGLENAVCLSHRFSTEANRRNQVIPGPGMTVLNCTVEPLPKDPSLLPDRPAIIFEDWDKPTYEGWSVEGAAFGPGPIDRAELEKLFGKDLGGESPRMINTYFRNKSNTGTGKLSSAPFTIPRRYINIWIGGGDIPGQTCVNLLVDGKVVQSQTGTRENKLAEHFFKVRDLEGKQAQLEIVDASEAEWGQISVGRITFADAPGDGTPLEQLPDYGSMALALLGAPAEMGMAKGSIGFDGNQADDISVPITEMLVGTLGRTVQLQPGETATVNFIVAWHFPCLKLDRLADTGRYYAKKFASAQAVSQYIATNFEPLTQATRLWRDTWYDSTLPYWFLDRTMINVSTLATSGCMRFASGRFYAWEGGFSCCPGTCTHVWQYAHSMARIFPELERDTRERVDLGVALIPATGVSGFRGEYDMHLAVDGQAGTILRIYREHQMSPDDSFLKRNWSNIKLMYKPLFALDPNEEGIMQGAQMNTLDQPWYGQISWMSSMYCAAARAGEQMAQEVGDGEFASKCGQIADDGFKNIGTRLFNGEYFFNLIDPLHANTANSGDGSHIDQVYGQSWAFQVGLPRILPEKETRTALQSLWKYNFSPDAGAYFAAHKSGRRFVTSGDAGMIMCTFPRTDWDYNKASGGDPVHHGFAYYFNETWTGNEYQVAGHMLWEGMPLEGMAMVRAIHDRYNPLKRNPYSEIECGGHYSRAMASHGVFLAACGYEYHGPKGQIGFAPKLSPENFRAPFTSAEGWGTYAQTIRSGKMAATLELKSGQLRLRSVRLAMDPAPAAPSATASLAGSSVPVTCLAADGRLQLQFANEIVIPQGQKLLLEIG